MASRFLQRAEKEISRKLATILLEVKDPRLDGRLAISRVVLSADLSYLKVYVFINEDEETQTVMLKALKKAVPFLRRRLGESVRLRKTPSLRIFHDRTPEDAATIESIIERLHETGQLPDDPVAPDPRDSELESDDPDADDDFDDDESDDTDADDDFDDDESDDDEFVDPEE